MGQVEGPVSDPPRCSTRRHVAQPETELGHRPAGREGDLDQRPAQKLQRGFQRIGVEAHRGRVVRRLVRGQLAADPHPGAEAGRGQAHVMGRRHHSLARARCRRQRSGACTRSLRPEARRRFVSLERRVGGGSRMQNPRADVRRRPVRLADPATGPRSIERRRRRAVLLDEGAVGRPAFDPVALALEPAVEPGGDLGVEVRGVDPGDMGILVLPWPDQRLGGRGQVRGKRRGRVDVGVRPAADGQHRRLDGRPVFADRAVPPVRVAGRMLHPAGGEEGKRLDPLDPAFPPVSA